MTSLRRRPAAPTLPLLFDPAAPDAGAWMALPLALLRRLPAPRQAGRLAFLGLAEWLATEAAPAARMTLRLAYVPVSSLAGLDAPLPLRAAPQAAPGCSARLAALPRLEAGVVRFGFRGARLILVDGRRAWVTGQCERPGEALLQVAARGAAGGAAMEVPLHRFALLVRDWSGPTAARRMALQRVAKNT